MASILSRSLTCLTLLSLFGAIWAAKLWTIGSFGSDLPNWDQWDAEALSLYTPYLEGTLTLKNFFLAHNEHRILFTQLLNLGLLELNGQWDARLQCVTNALLHASLGATVWFVLRRNFEPLRSFFLLILVLATFAVPYSMQNVLGGFHSQQYFLLWFSLGSIYLLLTAPNFAARWWVGAILGVGANFTMGSGVFAGASVVAVSCVVAFRGERTWRETLPTLLAAAIALLIGVFTRAAAENHVHMRAQSLQDFALTCAYCLEWPFQSHGWMAPICYLPIVLFACALLFRSRQQTSRPAFAFDYALLGCAIWFFLQIFATGYARGAGTPAPASRYLDTLSFGILVSVICFVRLLQSRALSEKVKLGAWGLFLAWVSLLGVGLFGDIRQSLDTLYPDTHNQMLERERNMRAYVATGDREHLRDKEIPYPDDDVLIARLKHESLRAVLPVSIREPLTLTPSVPSEAFRKRGVPPGLGAPSPGTPVIGSFSVAAGGTGQGSWKSSWFESKFSRIQLQVAGSVGLPGLHIFVGETTADGISFAPNSETSWTPVLVKASEKGSLLTATDENSEGWIAFSYPREMATLSYWAMRAGAAGRQLLFASLAVALISGIALTLLESKNRRPV